MKLFTQNITILAGVLLTLLSACQNNNRLIANEPTDTTQHGTIPTLDTIAPPTQTESVSDSINFSSARIPKIKVPVELKSGDKFELYIPKGMQISVAYETGSRIRFMDRSPDGRLFVTDMKDQTDNKRGEVLIFDDWDEEKKIFNKKISYLSGLHNPNDVAFYKDYIYIAQTGKLVRYPYVAGDNAPSGPEEILAHFPDYGLGYKYGGWHLTRSLAFHKDKLYVSVGSSCNACIEEEPVRASVLQMNPDGTDQLIYATGLRNSVGIGWIENQLWVTSMGRDWIGDERPEDLFQQVEQAGFYGWPYYYQYKKKIYFDEEFADSAKPVSMQEPPIAFMGMKAHSAPLGFAYLKGFEDSHLRNSVLIALHGPVVIKQKIGYSIVKAGANDIYVDVISGFLTGKTAADKHGRPCDILMNNAQSFFFTDDHRGVLYYVYSFKN